MSMSEDSFDEGDSFDRDSINNDGYSYDYEIYTKDNMNLKPHTTLKGKSISFEKDLDSSFSLRKTVSCTTCNLFETNNKVARNRDGGFALRKAASCSICTWDVDDFLEDDAKGSLFDDEVYQPSEHDDISPVNRSVDNTNEVLSNDSARPRLQRSNSYTRAMDEDDISEIIVEEMNVNIEIGGMKRLPPDGGESNEENEIQKTHKSLIGSNKKVKGLFPFKTFSKKKERKKFKENKEDSFDRKVSQEFDEIFGKVRKTPEQSFDEECDDDFHLNISHEDFPSSTSLTSTGKKNNKILKRLLPPRTLFTRKESKLRSQRSRSVEFLYTNESLLVEPTIMKSFSSMELALCGLDESEQEEDKVIENINELWISYLNKIGGMTLFGGNESLRYVWYQISCFQKDLLQHFEDFLKHVIEELQQAYMKCQELEGVINLKTERQEKETSKIYDDVERMLQEERQKLHEKHIEKEEQTRSELIKVLESKDQEIQELHKEMTKESDKIEKLQQDVLDTKEGQQLLEMHVTQLNESETQAKRQTQAMEEELILLHQRLNEEVSLKKELQDGLEMMSKEARIEKENYKQCLRKYQDLVEEKEFLDVSNNNLSTEVQDLKNQNKYFQDEKQKLNMLNMTSPYMEEVDFNENSNHHTSLSYQRSTSPLSSNSVASSSSFPEEPRSTTPIIQTPSGMTALRPRLPSIEQSKNPLTSTAQRQIHYRNSAQTPIKLASSGQTEFKVIFTGDMNVGKSSLIRRIVHGKFRPNREMTVEADYSLKDVEYNEQKLTLKLWDTVGQERFNSIPPSYFRKSDVVILMYDIVEDISFHNARTWIRTIHDNTNENVFLVLVANKSDCHDKRRISQDKGRRLAKDHDAMFIETSAKTGENIKELCDMIASTLLERDDTVIIRNDFENSLCNLSYSQRKFATNSICCS